MYHSIMWKVVPRRVWVEKNYKMARVCSAKFKVLMCQQFHGGTQAPAVEACMPVPDVKMSYEWDSESPGLDMSAEGQSSGLPCARDELLSHPLPTLPDDKILLLLPDLTVTEDFPAEYGAGGT